MKAIEEQLRLNDCYYDKKDWRACKAEVGVETQPLRIEMTVFTAYGFQVQLTPCARWRLSGNVGSVKETRNAQKART